MIQKSGLRKSVERSERRGGPCFHDDSLWRDPTGPKHWDLIVKNGDRVAVIRCVDVGDTNLALEDGQI